MVLVQFETRSKIGYRLYVAVSILLFMTEVDFIAILKLQMYIANFYSILFVLNRKQKKK
jgi:hypothetical protein